MSTPTAFDQLHELRLLEALEAEPETTQADLALRVGVAVGTVNWYLKRWASKGYVKARRMGRWNWRYLLTPQGIAERARLTASYLEVSMSLYRQTRSAAQTLTREVRAAGYTRLALDGSGELAEVCALTLLEQGLERAPMGQADVPVLHVDGTDLSLSWPAGPRVDTDSVKSGEQQG